MPHSPALFTLAMLSSYIIILLVLLVLIVWLIWRERATRLDPSNTLCGTFGLCQHRADCLDHACPGHPAQGEKSNIIQFNRASDSGECVATGANKS